MTDRQDLLEIEPTTSLAPTSMHEIGTCTSLTADPPRIQTLSLPETHPISGLFDLGSSGLRKIIGTPWDPGFSHVMADLI